MQHPELRAADDGSTRPDGSPDVSIAAATSLAWQDSPIGLSFGANKFAEFYNAWITATDFVEQKLSKHDVGPVKDSFAFSPAILREFDAKKPDGVINRFGDNVASLGVLAYDVDGDQVYGEATQRLIGAGYAFAGYSSYSHMRERCEKKTGETKPPAARFRIVIFLARPVVGSVAEMKHVVQSVGRELGIKYDASKVSPESLFYLPRHDGSEESSMHAFIDLSHFDGTPLDPTPFMEAAAQELASIAAKREENRRARAEREAKDSALEEADPTEYVRPSFATPWLEEFRRLCGPFFDIQAFALAYVDGAREGSPVEMPCPNQHNHTDGGDGRPTAYVYNASEDSEHDSPHIGCLHATCKSTMRTWDFVDLICLDQGVTLADALGFATLKGKRRYARYRGLPYRFVRFRGSVCEKKFPKGKSESDEDAKPIIVPITANFDVVGRVEDEHGQNKGTEIEFGDENGRRITYVVRDADLHSDDGKATRAALASIGLKVETNKKNEFNRLMNGLISGRTIVVVSKPGWHRLSTDEPVYLTAAGKVIGAKCSENWRLADGAGAEDRKGEKGTPDGWLTDVVGAAEVSQAWAPHHAFGLMVGIAGPLVTLVGSSSFAFYFQGDSSRGKSTTQHIIAACAGNPKHGEGTAFTCKATVNAVERLAAIANDATLGLDEIGAAPSGFVADFVFSFAGGTGKARMSRDASRVGVRYTWGGIATLSGEASIEAYLNKGRRRGAASEKLTAGGTVRLQTIPFRNRAEARNLATVHGLERALKQNYGHALPEFVRFLIAKGYPLDPTRLRARLDELTEQLARGKTVVEQRAARQFAVVWLAGELAKEAGLLGSIDIEKIIKGWAWAAFVGSDDAQGLSTLERGIEALKSWRISNPQLIDALPFDLAKATKEWEEKKANETAFDPVGEPPKDRPPSKPGFAGTWAWIGPDERGYVLYLLKDRLPEILGDTVAADEIIAELKNRGALWLQNRNTSWAAIPRVGAARHYRIYLKVLEGDLTEDVRVNQEKDNSPVQANQGWSDAIKALEAAPKSPRELKAILSPEAVRAILGRAGMALDGTLCSAALAQTVYVVDEGRYVIKRVGLTQGRGFLFRAERAPADRAA